MQPSQMQRIWSSGSAVWPPLIWPITSVSASSTTSLSIRPEPGIDGPPVWMVLWMPYLRAHPTILRAVGPSLTPPRPTSPSSLTPAAANSLKSSSTISHSMTGAPACTFTPPGRSVQNARCAKIAIALSADDIARPAGHVDFAGRDHRGDAAMQIAVDPADLVLPRRPVAGDGMDMAVDQARRDRGALGVDDRGGALGVDVLGAADRGDLAVFGDDRVGIEDRLLHRARQQQADIADHQFGRAGGLGGVMGHGFIPFWFNAFAGG